MPGTPLPQHLTIARGEDAPIPATPDSTTNITGWTLAFNLSTAPGAAVISGFPLTTTGGAITITNAAAGQFTVVIPQSLTILLTSGQVYFWDVWRTDVNTRYPLAQGTIRVFEPVRRPP